MKSILYTLFSCALLTAVACTPRATVPTGDTLPETPVPNFPTDTYAGKYAVTVSNTPAGTIEGELVLNEVADGLAGSFVAGDNTVELESVTTTDEGIRITFYSSEYQMDVVMTLNGDPGDTTLEGMTLGNYPTKAERRP